MKKAIQGHCLCGTIQIELNPPTDFVAHCHCESCRLSHGAPFVTWTSVPRERFHFSSGSEAIRWYQSSEWIRWGFCSKCGSHLLYDVIKDGHPESPKTDRMYVSVACLTPPLDQEPSAHYSFEERVPWLHVSDLLTKYKSKGPERLEQMTENNRAEEPDS